MNDKIERKELLDFLNKRMGEMGSSFNEICLLKEVIEFVESQECSNNKENKIDVSELHV